MAIGPDTLLQGIHRGGWLELPPPGQSQPMVPEQLLPEGDGVLISSGGSSGGRQVCLQPWSHLDQSSDATARWLEGIGIDPSETLLLNPLPLHHVSGLMPWWRSRCWGARHLQLSPSLMKAPAGLLQVCEALTDWGRAPGVVSLVPTQLHRLMADPAGLAWLQACAVIWVGGAALPESLADQARSHGLRLAPSYGATETAAMVASQTPEQFLGGEPGCGRPLADVQLRVGHHGVLMVQTPRLAAARWSERHPDRLQSLRDKQGWWSSGDAASFNPLRGLQIQGRLDGAIHSGGATVFPEQLEARLMRWVQEQSLGVEAVLLLAEPDPEWGDRLVALVRSANAMDHGCVLTALRDGCRDWPAEERPRRWFICPELNKNALGKWQRDRWQGWLRDQNNPKKIH